MKRQRMVGAGALAVFFACIPLANYAINHWGTPTFPGGPHTVPVGFGYDAPSGVLFIGLALVARDIAQRTFGWLPVLAAVVVGAFTSAFVASAALAVASGVAFGISETADLAVYTPLARRRLHLAVLASGLVGAVIDSLLFLQIAFGSTAFWQGNTLGKLWMSVLALPFLGLVRRAAPDHSLDPVGA